MSWIPLFKKCSFLWYFGENVLKSVRVCLQYNFTKWHPQYISRVHFKNKTLKVHRWAAQYRIPLPWVFLGPELLSKKEKILFLSLDWNKNTSGQFSKDALSCLIICQIIAECVAQTYKGVIFWLNLYKEKLIENRPWHFFQKQAKIELNSPLPYPLKLGTGEYA